MRAGGKLAAIVSKHVSAAVAELRAAVEAEIAQAIAGLTPGVREKPRRLPQERAKAPRRAKSAAPGESRADSPSGSQRTGEPITPQKRGTMPRGGGR